QGGCARLLHQAGQRELPASLHREGARKVVVPSHRSDTARRDAARVLAEAWPAPFRGPCAHVSACARDSIPPRPEDRLAAGCLAAHPVSAWWRCQRQSRLTDRIVIDSDIARK